MLFSELESEYLLSKHTFTRKYVVSSARKNVGMPSVLTV